jgi:hypothetical protein
MVIDMRSLLFGLTTVALLAAGCSAPQSASLESPSWFDKAGVFQGSGGVGAGGPSSAMTSYSSSAPVIIPVPEVPSVAPPIEGSPQTRQPYLYQPGPAAPAGGFGLPTNPGPVTGYGPGGLAQPPGAPPNPPFHF